MAPALLIIYASETGTAQDVAECAWRAALRRRLADVRLQCISETTLDDLIRADYGK